MFATPITSTDLDSCAITGITISWTGGPTPDPILFGLAQGIGGPLGNGQVSAIGTSPFGPISNPDFHTGNRPYVGLFVSHLIGAAGTWTAGDVTVTLS
jgi:hypothetical protein